MCRCRWCPLSFCEDCTDWTSVELIGDTVDEYRHMGFGIKREAYYISCPRCNDPMYREARRDSAREYAELMERIEKGQIREGGEGNRDEKELDIMEGVVQGKRKAGVDDTESEESEDKPVTPTPLLKKQKQQHEDDV
jgi:hypothetical protein